MTITNIYYSTIKGSLQEHPKKTMNVTLHKSHHAYTITAKSSTTKIKIHKNNPKSEMLNKILNILLHQIFYQQKLNKK